MHSTPLPAPPSRPSRIVLAVLLGAAAAVAAGVFVWSRAKADGSSSAVAAPARAVAGTYSYVAGERGAAKSATRW